MDSIIDKISNSKTAMFLGIGGAAVIGFVGYLYNQYHNEDQQKMQSQQHHQPNNNNQPQQPFNLKQQIAKFKLTLNLTNPTLQQVKQMIQFSFSLYHKQIQRIANDFKKSRRMIDRQKQLKTYLKTVAVGLIRMQQISSTLHQAIMIQIGITPEIVSPYKNQIGPFLHELKMAHALGSSKQITLGEVKKAINMQLDFFKQNGQQIIKKVVQTCKDWQIQAKKYIPQAFTIYLADQMYIKHPQLEQYDMKGAQSRFSKYLINQNKRVKQQMQPAIIQMCLDLNLYDNRQQIIAEDEQQHNQI